MPPKEKITILRNDDFQDVDDELSEAMSELDSANQRIIGFLDSELETSDVASAPEDHAVEAAREEDARGTPEEVE
jgi:hypothetical protein